MRDEIRQSKEIQAQFIRIFNVIDGDHSNVIERQEYNFLNKKLYLALQAFWDHDLPDLTEKELAEIAEEDWKEDLSHLPQGTRGINRRAMGLSLFQV